MRRITAWVAIFAVPTAVSGFFGQNVSFPSDETKPDFVVSVLLIAVFAAILYAVFKRKKWL